MRRSATKLKITRIAENVERVGNDYNSKLKAQDGHFEKGEIG